MIGAYISQLYRGRPYTKTIPFAVTLTTTDAAKIWTPDNAYFEIGRILIRGSVGAIDLNWIDTDPANVIAFSMPDTLSYLPGMVDFSPASYRSINLASNFLGLVDPAATGATFKGVVMGWEVTREGNYR